MTKEAKKTVNVFYSWQSDSDTKTNGSFIRSCIKRACVEFESQAEYENTAFVVDEATREEPGSPNIPLTIMRKIATSDIVVCDVTTINSSTAGVGRKVPNPNVVFELGYAVARQGWDRVILLFNEAHGQLGDMPFDFDRHRTSRYNLSSEDQADNGKKKSATNSLTSLIRTAIEQIIISNPKRPAEHEAKTPEEVHRTRDIQTLKFLLTNLPVNLLEAHIESLPDAVRMDIFHFSEGFHEIWTSLLTHVYRPELRDALALVDELWQETISYGHQYDPHGNVYRFNWKHGIRGVNTEELQRDYDKIGKTGILLRNALRDLILLINQDYIEIDLNETTNDAWRRYQKYIEDHERKMKLLGSGQE